MEIMNDYVKLRASLHELTTGKPVSILTMDCSKEAGTSLMSFLGSLVSDSQELPNGRVVLTLVKSGDSETSASSPSTAWRTNWDYLDPLQRVPSNPQGH